MNKSIADIRTDYKQQSLNETDVALNPFAQFDKWWVDAVNAELSEANAMSLATVGSNGCPSVRIVLLKSYDTNGFVFFTNYQSDKAQQIAQNPFAAVCFFWKELERQVRIEGSIEKTSAAESDEYFYSRPMGSRIGAWASPQSRPIADRSILEDNVKNLEAQCSEQGPARPPHWGGYIVKPQSMEFWQGRPSRLHDRIKYTRQPDDSWKIERLAP